MRILDNRCEPDPRGGKFHDPGEFLASGARALTDTSRGLRVPLLEVAWVDECVRTDETGEEWSISSWNRVHWEEPVHAPYGIAVLTSRTVERLFFVELAQAAMAEVLSDALVSCNGLHGSAALGASVAFHVSHDTQHARAHLSLVGDQRDWRLLIA